MRKLVGSIETARVRA